MKEYIVTVEETYFDATKFDFNKFYIVTEKGVEYRCLLKKVEKKVATFITVVDGEDKRLYISPYEIKNGNATIEEVVTLDEVVPLSKAKSEYKDLYYNDTEMKVGKCYEIKIGECVYKGFCSYRDSEDITMVLYKEVGTHGMIAAITCDPSTCGKWNEIIRNSITSGVIVKIDRDELKEDRVYFKELV